MTDTGGKKTQLCARLKTELRDYLIIFVYLSLLFGAFTTYRRIALEEKGIGYFHYGFGVIEALIMAKVILIGRALHVGTRFHYAPLLLSTLYKAFMFTLLALAFAIGEHMLTGWIHGTGMGEVLEKLSSQRMELAGRIMVLFISFIPLFALWEIGRVLGEDRLFTLFLKRRETA